MLRHSICIFFIFFALILQGQIRSNPEDTGGFTGRGNRNFPQDSANFNKSLKIKLSGKTKYTDYKVISYRNDTAYVDTTLSMAKYHKFNFIRKDDFELLPFHNQGQTFNNLGYVFDNNSLFPSMGARAMYFNFYDLEDVYYYHVPTPTTEIMYRTGLEQGQVLDAMFTLNTSKRFNASLAYKGLRSLGKYRTALSSHGAMRFTFNYVTKNNAYDAKGHVVAQDLTNEQNGGLTESSVTSFEADDGNFSDRARLATNFNDAESLLRGNRYYIDHGYKLWQRKDTLNNVKTYLKIGNVLNYQRKHYTYNQTSSNGLFGDSFTSSINDASRHFTFNSLAYLALKSPIVLGELKFKAGYYDFEYGYKSITDVGNESVPDTFSGDAITIGGEWRTQLKRINIDAEVKTILTGDITGNSIKATASYKQDSLFTFKGTFLNNSKSPNLNFLLNQSSYLAYNWQRNLRNEITRSLIFDLKSDRLLNAHAQITQLDNYAYFSDTTSTQTQPLPLQSDETINYLKIKVSKDLRIGKFGFDNTVMYQKVTNGASVLRVPEFVTRNSIYFADYLFKGDPLFLQTGVTLKYFTKYFANAYNPVLSEFNLQNATEIGGYPVLDFFINAQIQRTRLYFKLEHFNYDFGSTNSHFSAPNYPYRDFVIRFGLVWNFFI